MKQIKVYLQYPWKFTDSSYYRNLINNPPKNAVYMNKKLRIINSRTGFQLNRFLKDRVKKILGFVKIPNIIYTKNKKCDLIHCAHCLSLNKKPWIVDFERYEILSVDGNIAHSKKGIKI
jgi:hypothetical protein